MTLGQKIREIRKRLGLSQENLADILNLSRQAITKWESDEGIPDISNLQELSKLFNVTVDYLLDSSNNLPAVSMKKKLDKDKYKNKITSYKQILEEYYPSPWKEYILSYSNKLGKLEGLLNIFTGGDYDLIKGVSDLSPYYLVVKDNLKLLVNIKDWILEVIELPSDTNIKRFTYNKKVFINCGNLKRI